MHYALTRGRTDSSLPDIWVPMPGLVYDLHELPEGEYLLYKASGKLAKQECDALEVTDETLPPRTFKFERRIVVEAEPGKTTFRSV